MTDAVQRLTVALADRYTIERELGMGGMATVYLARDLKHERRVALKVLRPELGAVLGVERFLSEIRVTANLQHPHILPLYDSGRAEGLVFYVMPYVEGESLRQRLDREKQLAIEDALEIAKAVASALDYAHRHGVIHRDIKPENILFQDGQAVVSDFGIALALTAAGGSRLTETGLSLGTPFYMSPEQATGDRAVDARSDIYSLAAVVYEMISGAPPHTGPTTQSVIAKVVTDKPQRLTLLRETVPVHVDAAVLKALAKVPADRFHSAADFADALTHPGLVTMPVEVGEPAAGAATLAARPARWRTWSLRAAPWLVTVAAGVVAWVAWRGRPTPVEPVVQRYTVDLPDSLAYADRASISLAYSPDGSVFAYTTLGASGGIALRYADRMDPVPVAGTRQGYNPFFSPDGRWLGFTDGQRVLKVPLAGGLPVVVCDSCNGRGYVWGQDDVIRFMSLAPLGSLMQLPASGGRPTLIAAPDTGAHEFYGYPEVLPGSHALLFDIRTNDIDRLAALDLGTGRITRFEQIGSNPRYVASGHVLLGNRDGSIVAIPFDARRVRPAGPAVTVARDVVVTPSGAIKAGVSSQGSIVYFQLGARSERSLSLIERSGRAVDLIAELRGYSGARFSPDGRRIALAIEDAAAGSDVWVFDLGQRTLTRLTTDRRSERPAWTPDGRRIVYAYNQDLWWTLADGSGHPDSLLAAPGSRFPSAITPDGRTVIFWEEGTQSSGIRAMRLDSLGSARVVVPQRFDEAAPALSPDGRWLAYQSAESGRVEVYVRPYPEPGPRVPVSLNGGSEPCWSRDGRELFYRAGDAMMAASVRTEPTFSVTDRQSLFTASFLAGGPFREYDISPDGRRFVIVRGSATRSSLVAVHDFFQRLRYEGEHRR